MGRTQRQLWMEQIQEAERRAAEYCRGGEDCYRLQFHLMPPTGWLNDPNGLCQLQGVYYVFFQYSPLDAEGGMKCWGLYTSRNLTDWSWQGTFLLPDEPIDRDGVYSGSAYAEEGRLYLYYTGNVKEAGEYDYTYSGREANTVLVIYEPGKMALPLSRKQCVMTNSDYPAHYTCHIRDPKVWKKDESYYMIQGGRQRGSEAKFDKGAVLLFRSANKTDWTFWKEISTPELFGYMWECPDYFTLKQEPAFGGEVEILSVSPQGLEAEQYRFQNIYQSGYFTIDGLYEEATELGEFQEWDMGFDFYAPQTFPDEAGRRILIGWAGLPDADYDNEPTVRHGWQHALTMMRVLTWRKGKVYQNPVEEIKQLRKKERTLTEGENLIFSKLSAWELDIREIESEDFLLKLEQKGSGLALHYGAGIFSIEFYGENAENIGRGRNRREFFVSELQKVRIFADTSLIEIYLNDGEFVATTRYYMQNSEYSCELYCHGSRQTVWELDGFTIADESRGSHIEGSVTVMAR